MQPDETDIRTALERIRSTITSPGWIEHMVPTLAGKMDRAKNELVAMPQQRTPPFDKWSEDRISGYVLGLGEALNDWLPMIKAYDHQRALAAMEERQAVAADRSNGNPYSHQDHTEPITPGA